MLKRRHRRAGALGVKVHAVVAVVEDLELAVRVGSLQRLEDGIVLRPWLLYIYIYGLDSYGLDS